MSADDELTEQEVLDQLAALRVRSAGREDDLARALRDRDELWVIGHTRFAMNYDRLAEPSDVSAAFVNQTLRRLGYGRHTKGSAAPTTTETQQ